MSDARQYMIWAYKLRGCMDCGRKPIEAGGELTLAELHNHHRDPATKGASSSYTGNGIDNGRGTGLSAHHLNLRRCLEELAKCDVLCESCHKERHRNGNLGGDDPLQATLFSGGTTVTRPLATWKSK